MTGCICAACQGLCSQLRWTWIRNYETDMRVAQIRALSESLAMLLFGGGAATDASVRGWDARTTAQESPSRALP